MASVELGWWSNIEWWTIGNTVVSLLIGAVLTWVFSRRTSQEVRLILRALAQMAQKDEIEFVQDEKGRLVDFRIKRGPLDSIGVGDKVDPKLRRGDAPPE